MKTADRKKISTVLLVLSIVYGSTVGVLAVTGSGALTIVSIVGAAVLGIAWAAYGAWSSQD